MKKFLGIIIFILTIIILFPFALLFAIGILIEKLLFKIKFYTIKWYRIYKFNKALKNYKKVLTELYGN